ncbi:hypothetical protein [Kribbella sp. NPDC023855]|uniref:GH39 family glycosyl hydrolase n=1 Tax=Kribbella sp. NPDC023855 TaxID=3154698 RepID=UPI0033C346C1
MKTPVTTATVRVLPGRRADHPLSKSKFAVFNSGIVHAATYRRDAAALRATRPESVRIDVGWGADWIGYERTISEASADGYAYDFSELDEVGAFLNELGIRPYWSYCYVPSPYQPESGDWRDLAEDEGWTAMIGAYVEGARDRGVRVGYHEVYNEPDLRDERTGEAVFFGGDLDDYLALYRTTATTIRKADPDTPVGGPALASVLANEHWIPAFLDLVSAENLPLDFFSFHHYGTHSIGVALDKVLQHLESRPKLADVEVHLNEYNSYPVDYPLGGLQDTHHLAAAMLADFANLLASPGLTKVSWAQFLDSGLGNYSGMVSIDGKPKPVLSAYEFYQNMPVNRCALELDGPAGVGALAGTANGRLAVALWNRSPRAAQIQLDVGDGVYDAAVVRRIDADHDGTELEHVPTQQHWTFEVPLGGVVLLDLTGSADEPSRPAGVVRKVRHRYSGRRTSAWADLEEASTTFRLGTASDPQAVPVITADLAGCGPSITVTSQLTDAEGNDVPDGALKVRFEGPTASQEVELRTETATVQLAPLGAEDGEIRVTVALRDAPAHSFAVVDLA